MIPQNPHKESLLAKSADDIAAWAIQNQEKTAEKLIQTYIDSLFDWCNKWKIKLKPSNCKVTHFHQELHVYSFLCISNPSCECLAVFEAHGSSLNPISHASTHAKIACPCKRGLSKFHVQDSFRIPKYCVP